MTPLVAGHPVACMPVLRLRLVALVSLASLTPLFTTSILWHAHRRRAGWQKRTEREGTGESALANAWPQPAAWGTQAGTAILPGPQFAKDWGFLLLTRNSGPAALTTKAAGLRAGSVEPVSLFCPLA